MTKEERNRDAYLSWEFAISCLRAQYETGRKLTLKEMIALVDMHKFALDNSKAS